MCLQTRASCATHAPGTGPGPAPGLRARTGQAVLQRTGTGPTDRRSGPGGSSSRYIAPVFSRLAQSALPSSPVQTGLAGPACAALAEHEPPPEVHAQVPVRLSSPILFASESLFGPRAEKNWLVAYPSSRAAPVCSGRVEQSRTVSMHRCISGHGTTRSSPRRVVGPMARDTVAHRHNPPQSD